MLKEIKRDYTKEDLKMLEMAQVFHDIFIIDKTLFIDNFPIFADPYANEFQTAIDYADSLPLADDNTAEITVITEEIQNILPIIHSKLQELYAYTELAWDSKAKTYSFGKREYNSVRQSAIKLTELLYLGHNLADSAENKPNLLAVGYTQSAIDALETIADDVVEKYELREEMVANSIVATEGRIKAYNAVWGFMKQINKASKVVFTNSPAKMSAYRLYK